MVNPSFVHEHILKPIDQLVRDVTDHNSGVLEKSQDEFAYGSDLKFKEVNQREIATIVLNLALYPAENSHNLWTSLNSYLV